jgi:hypothetical protein
MWIGRGGGAGIAFLLRTVWCIDHLLSSHGGVVLKYGIFFFCFLLRMGLHRGSP